MGRIVARVPNEDPDRLKRILDAKYRTIGVDAQALEQQVNEKKGRESAEAQRDREYAKLSQYFDDVVSMRAADAEAQKRQNNRSVDSYRTTAQGVHTTREWDLNRPDYLDIDSPARIGDSDVRCGPASMQKFEGEDLAKGDRNAHQQAQCASWWTAQQASRAALAAQLKADNQENARLVQYQDSVQRAAAEEEKRQKSSLDHHTLEMNKILAAGRRAVSQADKDERADADCAELNAAMTNPVLVEDPLVAASTLSPYRVRKDHWKGMTEAEKKAIIAEQAAQVEAKNAQRARDAYNQRAYDSTQDSVSALLAQQARQAHKQRNEQHRSDADFLKQQMAEKADRDAALRRLYTNEPKPEFFRQFGTSHR